MKPTISVLIPTRSRADLLQHAVTSVLEQTYPHFELVISDNNSHDSTQEFCLSLHDPRVRYTRLEQDVTVDVNWNNAFFLAQGEYTILMGDDDYLVPQCLEELVQAIETHRDSKIFIYSQARYYAKDYPMEHLRNSVRVGYYSGAVRVSTTETILNQAFCFRKLFHSSAICIERALLRCVGNGGGPYRLPFPDYYAIFGACLQTDKIVMIDKLLVLVGTTARSCGTKTYTQQRAKSWNEHPLEETNAPPIRGNLFINGFYQSLSQLKSAFPSQSAGFSIDMDRYVELVATNIFLLKEAKVDVSLEYANLMKYMGQKPLSRQLRIRSKIALKRLWFSLPSSFRRWIRRVKINRASIVRLSQTVNSIRDCYLILADRVWCTRCLGLVK